MFQTLRMSAVALCFAVCAVSVQANLLDDGFLDLATSGSTTSNSAWVLTANTPDGAGLAAQFQSGFANANNTGAGERSPLALALAYGSSRLRDSKAEIRPSPRHRPICRKAC